MPRTVFKPSVLLDVSSSHFGLSSLVAQTVSSQDANG